MMKIAGLMVALLCFAGVPASALIMTGTGNAPVSERAWPAGAVKVANLSARLGWWEGPPFGGGEWHFEYRGDTAAFQEALDFFGRIGSPALDLFIHDGTQSSFVLDMNHTKKTALVDWTFMVWDTNSWEALYGRGKKILFSDDPNAGKPRPPPRLDVYPAGGRVAFEKIKLPPNVSVHDERAVAAGVDTSAGTVLVATITDARTGAAVAGARFQVTGRDDAGGYARPLTNAVADARGVARITGLPAGVFQLSATAEGCAEAVVAYEDLPERVYRKFAVALARAGTLSGRVVDTAGAPVGNARVLVANTLLSSNVPYRALHKPETLTDGAGRFTLTNVPVGLVQLRAWLSGYYQTNALDYHTVPGANVALVVAATGALVVQVRDAAGRGTGEWKQQVLQVSVEPSTGAVVGSWGGSANLRPDGTYRFTEVHPGSYLVKLLNTPRQATVLVLPNQTAEVSWQLP